jgi:CRISPR associated protein
MMTPAPPPPTDTAIAADIGAFTTWRSALTLSPQASRLCRDAHRLHELVLNGFRAPGTVVTTPPPPHVLYAAARPGPPRRTATGRTLASAPVDILVQSPEQPTWQPLLDLGLVTRAHMFTAHQQLAPATAIELKTITNPTFKRAGKVTPIADDSECGTWLKRRLAEHGIDAVPTSVSPITYLTGISQGGQLTVAAREDGGPRVGIYTVITRLNIGQIPAMGRFAAELGVDYYVPQPIALEDDHLHHEQLSLRPQDTGALADAFAELYTADLPLALPAGTYPGQVAAGVPRTTSTVKGCFGGRTLHFIQPDGTIWDCVSSLRINATPASAQRTIRGRSAAELFPAPAGCASDCPLASYECVNMWPLMDFDRILTPASRSAA